jgi:cell division protein FtsB
MGEDDDNNIEVALANESEKAALQDRVATLEDEVQKYKHQIENLQSEN